MQIKSVCQEKQSGFKFFVAHGDILKLIPSFLRKKVTVEEIVFRLIDGYEGKDYHLLRDS